MSVEAIRGLTCHSLKLGVLCGMRQNIQKPYASLKNQVYLFTWMCISVSPASVHVHRMCAQCCGGQKMMSDALELELQMAVS